MLRACVCRRKIQHELTRTIGQRLKAGINCGAWNPEMGKLRHGFANLNRQAGSETILPDCSGVGRYRTATAQLRHSTV
jgi:hypothetical protein